MQSTLKKNSSVLKKNIVLHSNNTGRYVSDLVLYHNNGG